MLSGGSIAVWCGLFEDSRLMQALVVDDSAVYRKLIGDHLRSWGFGVTLAADGAEANRILDQPGYSETCTARLGASRHRWYRALQTHSRGGIVGYLPLRHPFDREGWPSKYARRHAGRSGRLSGQAV